MVSSACLADWEKMMKDFICEYGGSQLDYENKFIIFGPSKFCNIIQNNFYKLVANCISQINVTFEVSNQKRPRSEQITISKQFKQSPIFKTNPTNEMFIL